MPNNIVTTLLYAKHIPSISVMKCKICVNNNINAVFIPCGHIACCISCSINIVNCIICNAAISEKAIISIKK
jgi:hypothetical protein